MQNMTNRQVLEADHDGQGSADNNPLFNALLLDAPLSGISAACPPIIVMTPSASHSGPLIRVENILYLLVRFSELCLRSLSQNKKLFSFWYSRLLHINYLQLNWFYNAAPITWLLLMMNKIPLRKGILLFSAFVLLLFPGSSQFLSNKDYTTDSDSNR